MKLLNKLSTLPTNKRKWTSVLITVLISALLTVFGIFGIGEYGIALFILTPTFMGLASTVLFGYKNKITQKDANQIGFLTLGIFTAALFFFAMEGLICIIMAAPIGLLFTWLGSLVGYALINKTPNQAQNAMLSLILIIPITHVVEQKSAPNLNAVTTSIEINAKPEIVWKNVIEFPQLKEPTEFIFKTGIAYPINAKIDGDGTGALRHCNFTTGSFTEPVTVWEAQKLLRFDVLEQPATMKEISFWNVNAPHLHDYFVSKRGQFKLIALANGKTRLEGTTWYYHNIKPAIYWQIWSNYIVHKIHSRVLNHIKQISEHS